MSLGGLVETLLAPPSDREPLGEPIPEPDSAPVPDSDSVHWLDSQHQRPCQLLLTEAHRIVQEVGAGHEVRDLRRAVALDNQTTVRSEIA